MNVLLQIALIVIPAAAVLLTTIFFLRRESEKETSNLRTELKKQRQKYFLPGRVESYQRVILLMERIHPGNLTMRLHKPNTTAKSLQTSLLKAIREEYDHNVAEQIFISPKAWEMVKKAKEESVKIINIACDTVGNEEPSTKMATKLFEIIAELENMPTEITIGLLKKELQELF